MRATETYAQKRILLASIGAIVILVTSAMVDTNIRAHLNPRPAGQTGAQSNDTDETTAQQSD